MTSSNFRRTVLTVAICAGLSACGGADNQSAGIGGSGNGPDGGTQNAGVVGSGGGPRVASVGTITGFGSVFVNGVEYFTSEDVEDDSFTTSFVVDGVVVTNQNDLRIGMVVRINGELDKNSETGEVLQTSGRALSVAYDDDVEGPVTGISDYVPNVTTSRQFTVLGTIVRVQDGLTVFDDTREDRVATDPAFNFGSLADNDVVEVSGFLDGDGVLLASRIERKSIIDSGSPAEVRVEIKGNIVSGSINDLGNGSSTFTLSNGGQNFTITLPTEQVSALTNEAFIEVKGSLGASGTEIDATAVEVETDDSFEDTSGEDKVSIEGLVANLATVAGVSRFNINGEVVTYDSNTVFEPASLRVDIANGIKVEAEGPFVGGELRASKIEARSGSIKIETLVSGVDTSAKTISLNFNGQTIIVRTDNRSVVRDDDDMPLLLDLIAADDFLEIEAFASADGGLLATYVKREEVDDDDDAELKIQAPLAVGGTSFDSATVTGSITLRLDDTVTTITINTTNSTEFKQLDDSPYSAPDFFAAYGTDYSDGDLLEIELDASGNASEVEVKSSFSSSSDGGVSSSASSSSSSSSSSAQSSSSSSSTPISSSSSSTPSSSSSSSTPSSSSSSSTPSSSSSSSTPSSSSSSSTPTSSSSSSTPSSSSSSASATSSSSSATPSSSSSSTTTPDGVPDLSGDGTPED